MLWNGDTKRVFCFVWDKKKNKFYKNENDIHLFPLMFIFSTHSNIITENKNSFNQFDRYSDIGYEIKVSIGPPILEASNHGTFFLSRTK